MIAAFVTTLLVIWVICMLAFYGFGILCILAVLYGAIPKRREW